MLPPCAEWKSALTVRQHLGTSQPTGGERHKWVLAVQGCRRSTRRHQVEPVRALRGRNARRGRSRRSATTSAARIARASVGVNEPRSASSTAYTRIRPNKLVVGHELDRLMPLLHDSSSFFCVGAQETTSSCKFQDVKQQSPRHDDQQAGQDDPNDHAANSRHQRPPHPT